MGELWKILFKSLDPRCQVYLKRPSRLGFEANENLKRMNFQQLSQTLEDFQHCAVLFCSLLFWQTKMRAFWCKKEKLIDHFDCACTCKSTTTFSQNAFSSLPLRPHESSAVWPNPDLSLKHFNEIYARPWLHLQVDGLCLGLPLQCSQSNRLNKWNAD